MIYFAACAANQTDLLETEARNAGSPDVKVTQGGVFFKGDLETGYRFCMWSRVATRLLLMIHEAKIGSADDFYDHSFSLSWENYLDPKKTFAVYETVSNCRYFNNSRFAAVRLKDAIVDRIREHFDGERPSVDVENPDIAFHLHIDGDNVTYYIDFSGKALSRRGYRKGQTSAVLSEFLAASVVLRSPWYKDGMKTPFLDPFCGSGTLCVEAALLATCTAPGLIDPDRFAFYGLPFHDEELWRKVFDEADAAVKEPECRIIGWDVSAKAIKISRANARAAGMDFIEFSEMDFRDVTKEDIPAVEGDLRGCVVTDPPYGVRMLESEAEIKKLYIKTGKVLTQVFEGWNACVLCGQRELLSYVDMKPHRTNTLYNGGIECQLAHYYIYTAEEKQALIDRALARKEERLSKPLSSGAQMAYNRLIKNIEAIRPKMEEQGVSCYRVYDADMPEYSAAIDVYENKWVCLQEYAAPSSIDPEDAKRRLEELVLATERALGIDLENIFIKQRAIQKGDSQYTKNASDGKYYLVKENGHRFMVNFTDYLDTGIFLDHRPVRKYIEENAQGKRFLNLFCYTGTATVHAAAGGALSSVSVDSSAKYLQWAQKNMELNGLDKMNHFFYQQDVMEYLKDTRDKFDLIFCDPPTFSNSKNRDRFDVQYDHSRLIKGCMNLLSSDGLLIFSTNYTRFKFDEYLEQLFDVEEISAKTIGDDFQRNKKIHYCWLIRKKKQVAVKVKPVLKKKEN